MKREYLRRGVADTLVPSALDDRVPPGVIEELPTCAELTGCIMAEVGEILTRLTASP